VSASDEDRLTLRSYRLAFDIERRLHRIDRFRIPVPYGIPLIALSYGLAMLAVVLGMRAIPVVGDLLTALPLPMQLVLLPGLAAHGLCRTRADGRPAHEACAAWIRRAAGPRHLVALRRAPHSADGSWVVAVAGDECGPTYATARISGPTTVLLRQPARLTVRGRSVHLQQLEDRPMSRARELTLSPEQRLVIG
jgi:hypothetical protein